MVMPWPRGEMNFLRRTTTTETETKKKRESFPQYRNHVMSLCVSARARVCVYVRLQCALYMRKYIQVFVFSPVSMSLNNSVIRKET